MKRSLALLPLLAGLTGCAPSTFDLYIYNPTKKPLVVTVNGEPQQLKDEKHEGFSVKVPRKPETQVQISAGDKVKEQLTVGQPPLDPNEQQDVIFLAGGPHLMAIGDYQAFYSKEGASAAEKPKIREIVNLSKLKFHKIPHDAVLNFPSRVFPRESQDGKPTLRLVPLLPEMPPDKLEFFMHYELGQTK